MNYFEEFCNEHGQHVKVPNSNYLQFEDGATLEQCGNRVGASNEPPEDRFERAKHIQRFYQIRLDEAVGDFDRFRNSLVSDAKECVRHHNTALLPDRRESLAELKRLKRIVTRAQKKLEQAKDLTTKYKPRWLTERENDIQDSYNKAESFMADVQSIQI